MQKRVWKARVLPGMLEEYIRRHDEIWPEMSAALRESGISNYTIWSHGSELIGYYECPDIEAAEQYKANSLVMKRWSDSMRGVMEMAVDEETGGPFQYRQVFELP